MNLSTEQFKAREAFVEADPSYAELERKAIEARDKATASEQGLRMMTNRLQRLLYLRDITIKQTGEMEDIDEDFSEQLERITGNHIESWWTMTHQVTDEVSDVIHEVCRSVAELCDQRDARKQEQKDSWSLVWQKARELRTIWDAMQEDSTELEAE